MLDLAFRPDPTSGAPAYRQLCEYIRELIASGRLEPGEQLPASRTLSVSLGLSRNTVNSAYRALRREGLVSAGVGRGTFVTSRPLRSHGSRPKETPSGLVWDQLVAVRTRELPRLPGRSSLPSRAGTRFDFIGGRVDPDSLPLREIRRALTRAVDHHLSGIANPDDPLGWQPLREEIAGRLVSRGIGCGADDVLITAGAQQALDLVSRVLLDPDDPVAIEQPGYFGAARAFQLSRARIVGIPVDEHGLSTDELALALRTRRPKLIYVTPSVQCPTGVTLDAGRRRTLLDLADSHQVPVLEDDYESELRFEPPSLPCLRALDRRNHVIYVGTFSKALYPGLRVGYVVAARALLHRLAAVRFTTDLASDMLSQAALLELIRSEALDRHVRRARARYAERREALLGALERHMPSGVSWTRPDGGLQLWLHLPPEVDPDILQADAREVGIAYARGELFYTDGRGAHELALSFARLAPNGLAEGAALLADRVRRQLA